MESLLIKKRTLKSKITKAVNDIGKHEFDSVQLELYEKKCEEFNCECSDLFNKLLEVVEEKSFDEYLLEQQSVQDNIDSLYVTVKRQMLKLNVKDRSYSSIQGNSGESVKLPKLNLPAFNGNIQDWLSFKDLFKSSIHNNTTLSDSQKLSYLKLSLHGEAARIIQSIIICDSNYQTAWDLLEERYSNKRDQVFAQIKRLLSVSPIQETPSSILKLVDVVNESVRSLEVLDQHISGFSETLLAYILLQKLDTSTRLWWERDTRTEELPKVSEITTFLKNYARTLQASRSMTNVANIKKSQSNQKLAAFVSSVKNQNFKCICCNGNNFHYLYKCSLFLKMSVNDRLELVKKHRICFNCLALNPIHSAINCTSKMSCVQCFKRHHSLLHFPREEMNAPPQSSASGGNTNLSNNVERNESLNDYGGPSSVENQKLNVDAKCFERSNGFQMTEPKFAGASANHSQMNSNTVLLSTAIIYVKDACERFVPCRALLDSGSQCCAFSSEFANILGQKRNKITAAISCLNGMTLPVKSTINATISNKSDFSKTLEFFVVAKINDVVPMSYVKFAFSQLPNGVMLADPNFNKPQKIDALLGAECFYELLKSDRFRVPNSSLTFQNTVFGYVASGVTSCSRIANPIYCGFIKIEESLDALVKSFWEIESVSDFANTKSQEELECEDHFLQTHCRDAEGRYVVSLAMKKDIELGDSLQLASQRLNSLWNRIDKNPNMCKMYCDFMDEYESLGHMQSMKNVNESPKYIMPHHGVYKESSSTTKLRVVFNASAPSSSGCSLNDSLLNGGVVQDDLFSILLRFRNHKVAFIADIRKMYRQIRVNPEQCKFQCILWKKKLKDSPQLYKLLTVTYGTKSAPYLATRVLKQLALDEQDKYPLASKTILKECYVDDILSGAKDVTAATELQTQLILMLKSAKMELHKWCSNQKVLLDQISYENQEYNFEQSEKNTVKTLGMRWNPNEDIFSFTVSRSTKVFTKRSVLAEIAKLFDPLGLLGPVIMCAKIFLQKLWCLKVEWDDALPLKMQKEWMTFQGNLPELKHVEIPRYTFMNSIKEIEIHGFADASKDGYGGVVYLRCVSEVGDIKVTLLCSKSRVSPLKVLTIPRLELCAAELLSKLVSKVSVALNLNIDKVILHSDSRIVLAWIEIAPHLLKVFVSNRVARIQELTKTFSWKHVKTADNPADLISRGVDPNKIANNTLWWQGPSFLSQQIIDYSSNSHIDKSDEQVDESYIIEFRKCTDVSLTLTVDNFLNSFFSISNSYSKLIHVFAYILRFIQNCRAKKIRGQLTAEEVVAAENQLLSLAQKQSYPEDFKNLSAGKEVTKNSPLKFLCPFLDKFQVIRVGGRLQESNLSFNTKHPIVLPKGHRLSHLIMLEYHTRNFHVGAQTLLHSVRQKYWPLGGRNLARRITRECVTCTKFNPVTLQQKMGNLPVERINPSFPFNHTGIDFCGPFLIKYRNLRKGVLHKIYVAIFVCLSTRAVHFEIVSDLSSDSFIASLKRFISRRGKCASIFTDNARNFVGANNELKRLYNLVKYPDNNLSKYLSSETIEWKFIPPRAPHFGGIWEAGVKSFKFHLKRAIGKQIFTYEEFLTITNQIEMILNSRPLTPLSSDPNDIEVLTPAHFLIGRPFTSVVEPDITDLADNALKRWQRTTKVTQYLWKRWQNDYLSHLQQRYKWYFSKGNVNQGTIVLVKEDNMPISSWCLGKVEEVIYGKDKKVRVCIVKTKSGLFKRPITKLAVLPVQIND